MPLCEIASNTAEKSEATIQTTDEEVDPGNLQSRWAPCVRTQGSGQRRIPSRSIRPRGYVSPAEKPRPSGRNISRGGGRRQRCRRDLTRLRLRGAPSLLRVAAD